MAKYRYVGTFAEIRDTPYKFTRYGQLVDLPADVAELAIEEGCLLMPAADFDKLGQHTEQELNKYGSVSAHANAPPDFITRRNAVWASFAEPKTAGPKDVEAAAGTDTAGIVPQE